MMEDLELDPTALAVAVVVVIGVALYVMSGTFGWDKVPLWMRIAFPVLCGPVAYFITIRALER